MKVGENIRNIRDEKKLTQEYMAHELGLSINGYGKIERNESNLSLDRLAKIAEVLEVDISQILNPNNQYAFTSTSHNQTGGETKSGVFHNDSDKQFITDMKNQVDRLIHQNERLVNIIEKNIK